MHIELVDKALDPNEYEEENMINMIEIALLCTQSPPNLRPIMSEVVLMLSSGGSFRRLQMTRPTVIHHHRRIHVDAKGLHQILILCITRQLGAFRVGFNQVFEASSLQIFSPSELDYLLCGRREMWEADTLVEHIKFDHGYTSKSPVVINLLEIMGEFNPEQQRAFCQFVTGAPRLPPGGLAVLNPKVTIVRKVNYEIAPPHSNNTASNAAGGVSESADDDLPSVMTCANYLKLPPYSTKTLMQI
uniref:HECT domain-containing protein n=1 Tax=Lactuca sativa TaxID=4236 RepID=A0A9R1WYP1_LACSA|nr:hypothetical protein LSAT_V11C800409110 [Lactuca sativa]